MDLTIRPITDEEVDLFRRRLTRGFGGDAHEDEDSTNFRRIVDVPRTVAAFDGRDLVGTCAAFTLDVTVPGGALPMGGTTMVTVQPTHRRRGVMRAMMRAHLDEVRGRGEPLAGLWASEGSIYARFGFGRAAEACDSSFDGRAVRFPGDAPAGAVRLLEPEQATAILPPIYDRARAARPGMLSRNESWWAVRHFNDARHRRGDRSSRRTAVYESRGAPAGYAVYRQKLNRENVTEGELFVVELVAETPQAHEALWRFLSSIDLFPNVRYAHMPVDDELPWRLIDAKRVERSLRDTLWLRLVDVPEALSRRCYGAEGRVVLEVRDPFMPHNEDRYLLDASPGGAACARSSREPDLLLGVDALSAVYLGGHRPSTLARAGLVHGTPEVLAIADRLFAWTPLPWCPEVF